MALAPAIKTTREGLRLLYPVDVELDQPQIPSEIAAVAIKGLDPSIEGLVGTIKTLPFQRRLTANLTYSYRPTIPMERANYMKVSGQIHGEEVCSALVRTSYWIVPRPFVNRAIINETKRQKGVLATRALEILTSQT